MFSLWSQISKRCKMEAQEIMGWTSNHKYVCPGCGEEFRMKYNYDIHINNCLAIKLGDKYEEE